MYIKIGQEPFNAQKNNLVLDERFDNILNFLISRSEKVTTLRDIKRAFPEIENFDRYIDDLVKTQLLTRYHGRYHFSGEVISKATQENINEKVLDILNNQPDLLRESLRNELLTMDSLAFFYLLFKNTNATAVCVYEKSPYSDRWFSLPTRCTEFQGKREHYFSIAPLKSYYGNNIPDYFNYLMLNQINLPDKYLKLRDTLGDLNQSYFIQYCERKLRRLEKGKVISSLKPDIFMKALNYMNYVNEVDDKYQFNLIRLDKQIQLPLLLDELLKEFEFACVDFSVESTERTFMIKCILVSWLLDMGMINFPKTLHGVL